MRIAIDPSVMTLKDLEDYEAASGSTIGELIERFEKGNVSMRDFSAAEVIALVWVFARREEPDLTLDDVKGMRLVDLQFASPPEGAS